METRETHSLRHVESGTSCRAHSACVGGLDHGDQSGWQQNAGSR